MENNIKKRNNMYDPVYVSKRDNISIEEATLKIKEFKENKATSLVGFIKRYGEEIGKIKFEEFKKTSKHTIDKYIVKYGEEIGKIKWTEFLKKKDSTSFKWALKKANGNNKIAKEIYEKRLSDLSIRFDDDYFFNKYGDDYLKEMDRFKKSKDTSSYNWALNKANGDYKLADEIYYNRCESKSVTLGMASKESLIIFEPLIEWLISKKISKEDIFCGINGSNEICLYNNKIKKRYYYDFCIKSLKLIFEYNGEIFHPNYEKYSIDYLNENWKHPYNKNINLCDAIEHDKLKIKNAIEHGYDIHIVWSSDEDKLEKIKKIIKKKLKYEN